MHGLAASFSDRGYSKFHSLSSAKFPFRKSCSSEPERYFLNTDEEIDTGGAKVDYSRHNMSLRSPLS